MGEQQKRPGVYSMKPATWKCSVLSVIWLSRGKKVEKGQILVCSDLHTAECAGELKERFFWSWCTFSYGVSQMVINKVSHQGH